MTNRLLLIVIVCAFTSGVVAHAASAPQQPLTPFTLPAASSLPMALQTAASRIGETATGAIDPSAAIRGAYLRDHVALEHLRLSAATQLPVGARPAYDQLISDDEAALTERVQTALATTRPSVSNAIAGMDAIVASAQAELNRELTPATTAKSQASAPKSQGANRPGKPQGGDRSGASQGNDRSATSQGNDRSAKSRGDNHSGTPQSGDASRSASGGDH
jgi:hypothetical protein